MSKAESYGKPVGRPRTGRKKIIHINISHDTLRRLMEFCQKTGRTMASVTREAIELFLDKKNKD